MNVLFVGNSLLISLYRLYIKNNKILGENIQSSFAIDIGGWGPGIKILDNKIVPSDRSNKEKYPDVFSPESVLETPISNYDVIIVVALGYLCVGLEKEPNITTFRQVYQFQPVENNLSNIPISKAALIEAVNGYFESQSGIKFLDFLSDYKGRVIVLEQPLFNELIKNDSDWSLSKIYKDPVSAVLFFQELRRKFLLNKCEKLGYTLINALFEDFTPAQYKCAWDKDYFHTGDNYGNLLYDQIRQVLLS